MTWTSDSNAYKLQIDNDISTQSLPSSIPPDVVGSGYTDLVDMLTPYINSINNESILSGTGVPSSGTGNNLDLYFRTQSSYFELYRKESGSWVLKVSVPFGITLPDGPATLRSFITGSVASVTKGGWFISNAVYNKATQTNFTVPAADATFYRTDLIYANTSNQILYLTGTPSLTPADPTLPANTIAVDYVIVPSVASGFDPYLRYGSTTESNGLAEQNDTGALTYGGITVASSTTVNIGACTGYVVNNESVPGNPTIIYVNYAGETNKTVTTLGSGIATYVLLNGAGVIVFQNTFPTSAQRKTHIYLSKIGHPAGTITTAGNEVDFVLSPLAQHRDLFQAINYINEGVAPSASGATLSFALSTGKITGDGINFVADRTNPNTYTVAPQPTASFLPRTQTGAGGTFTSTVDVANYDVAGTVTAIPGGGNTSTIRYIYLVPTLGLIVQYGQTTYANLTDAIAAVGKESFTIYPSLVRNAILVGALAATKSATALNNTTQARFFLADKFGQLGGASSGISTATLQTAYNNSLQPQILTDATRGAVQFKRGSAADTDNVVQVLNAAGTSNFSVSGNGAINSTESGHVGGVGFTESSMSPQITGHQGYAWDGTYHYISDTARLDKRNNDGTWSISTSNSTPFASVTGTVNHIGDICVLGGIIYAPVENLVGSTANNQKVVTYNASTLAFVNQFDISAQNHETTAIAIDSVNNIAYIASYYDGTKLYKYNATTFAYIGPLLLPLTIGSIQGLSYENGIIYIASEVEGIYKCDPSTGALTFLLAPLSSFFIPEGLDVVSGQLRWMIDNVGDGSDTRIHFYDANTVPNGFYTDKSGNSYFSSNLLVNNLLQVSSDDKIGSINVASNKTTQIYLKSLNGVRGTIGHDDLATSITRNAYFDGGWLRPDVSKASLGFLLSQSNNRFEFRSSAAAANPLVWLTPAVINASGKIIINNATENVFDGTGTSANEQIMVLKNTNSLAASGIALSDNGGTRFCSLGVVNTASTIGGGYGLIGEGFVRSSTSATGLHLSVVNGPMRFSVSNGIESFRIFQATRNVTIGGTTDDGSSKLQVAGVIRTLIGAEAMKVGTDTGNPDHAYIGLYARTATPTTVSGRIGYTSAAATTLSVVNDISGGGMTLATTGASTMLKQTNAIQLSVTNSSSAEVARISQGTTASTTTSNIYWMQSYLSTHSVGSEIRLNNGGGTLASQTAIASGNALGLIQFGGNTTTAMSSAYNSVAIKAVSTELFSPTAGGSKLEFYTTPNGTVTQTKALTIDQDGSLVHAGSRTGTAIKWLGVDSTGKVVDAAFVYNFSQTYDVPSLAAGAVDTHTVTVSGCVMGDFVIASMDTPLGDYLTLKAYVSSSGSVTVVFHNTSTGTIDLVSATLRIKVIR